MYNFCFMLKTYNQDIHAVDRLVKTFIKHTVEKIHLYIVIPKTDYDIFKKYENDNISIVIEEKIDVCFFTEAVDGLSVGYLNQEICKLAFWKLNLCDNYCCLDSECYFIRDFYYKDFMYDETTPYTVLFEDKDLQVDYQYYKYFWKNREPYLEKIANSMELNNHKILTCHGFQNMSKKALKSFEHNYLSKFGYTYKDIIKIAPYEFSWYNLWLQKNKDIPIYICEPFFKTYHTQKQYWRDIFSGITEKDLARSYVGIVINGNFISKGKIINYGEYSMKQYFLEQDRMNIKHIFMVMKLLIYQPVLFCKGFLRAFR